MTQSIRIAILFALSPVALAQPARAEDAATEAPQVHHRPDSRNRRKNKQSTTIGPSRRLTGALGSLKTRCAILHQVFNQDYQNSMATNFKDVSKYLPLVAYQSNRV